MKVFISWSGERSQSLAQALHKWLPMVLQYVDPWLSKLDIKAGDRWANEVAKELETSNFGIICVTSENIVSPWILFEAGALAKSMLEGRVIPLLLDIELRDLTGPLSQFQAKKTERSGMLDVVTSINSFAENKLTEARLSPQFEMLWSAFETDINNIPKTPTSAKQKRPEAEVLEELVSGIRGLESRFRESMEDGTRMRRRRNRFHPAMIEELVFNSKLGRNDPVRLLVLASLLKEDLPWIYELGLEAYREALHRSSKSRDARQRFLVALKGLRHGPMLELMEDKEGYMIVREIERAMMEFEEEENHRASSSKDLVTGQFAAKE